jgi:glycosyltransferase involved in cell wall biosynthesis
MKSTPTVLSMLDLNPRKFGSMEEFTCAFSAALTQRNCRSIIVFSEEMPDHVASWFHDSGAIIESLNQRIGFKFYSEMRSLVKKYEPDIVHFHFYEQFSWLPLWAVLCGVKVVFFTDHCRQPLHARRLTRLKLRFWNLLVPRFFKTRLITISDHMKRLLVSDFFMAPDNIDVVLNGVNTARFKPRSDAECQQAREQYGVPSESLVVSTAAALIPEKGIADFLDAAQLILKEEQRAFFLVAGDGSLENQLKERSVALGLTSRVRFVGLVADISKFLAIANVIVIPSVWQEPAGLVVIESMACGRPVVATRVGGIPEYVADGRAGVLIEPKRPDMIAEAVLKFLRNPELSKRIGLASRLEVERSFTTQMWVDRVLRLYGPEFQGRESEQEYAAPGVTLG